MLRLSEKNHAIKDCKSQGLLNKLMYQKTQPTVKLKKPIGRNHAINVSAITMIHNRKVGSLF